MLFLLLAYGIMEDNDALGVYTDIRVILIYGLMMKPIRISNNQFA
jgi:hypothetical protein